MESQERKGQEDDFSGKAIYLVHRPHRPLRVKPFRDAIEKIGGVQGAHTEFEGDLLNRGRNTEN